jgi:hypothetical protein
MASIGLNVAGFIAQLESDGVEKVRLDLASGLYNEKVGEKGTFARNWLNQKEQELATAASARNYEIQERATRAAERQATAAETATKIAKAAFFVSLIALGISVVAIFWK